MVNKTQQWLLQIKTNLEQQDFEMAQRQVKLTSGGPEISDIVESIQNYAYQRAIELIDGYLADETTEIVEYQDAAIEELRAQLKELEAAIELLSEQKSEQLFLLHEFTIKQSTVMGEIFTQILHIRKDIEQEKLRQRQERYEEAKQALNDEEKRLDELKRKREMLEEQLEKLDELDFTYDEVEEAIDSLNEDIKEQQKQIKKKRKKAKQEQAIFEETSHEAYEEAKQEYEQFDESYHEAKDDKFTKLNDEDIGLLKKLYRKAVKLCHPDTVADEYKDQSHEITQKLNNARDNGDIKTVELLLEQLEKGLSFEVASDRLSDREQIESKIEQLVVKLEEISDEIEAINQNETWQLMSSIGSWDTYFEEQRIELSVYLEQLQAESEIVFNIKYSSVNIKNTSDISNSPTNSTSKTQNYWNEEF
ncbi:hypothetical protein GPUN_1689 [Glaciecola punicea ACAM 611]|uniref:J domain-containing protein n=1 Tax=Glaciecola punicea ACAM 611 TaxID=1121923 RepID=H5TBX8_9ALTE|nr:hypothetical protein [Glaciecola punicea]GAB55805.1 hypothetical protein GPUN_1689 [Glaciecola punicea ACAM 611]